MAKTGKTALHSLFFLLFATVVLQADPSFKIGDAVSIKWSGGWFPGQVLKAESGRYFVKYDGWGESSNEWVTPDRLQRPGVPGTSPAAPPIANPQTTPSSGSAEVNSSLVGTWKYTSWTMNGQEQLNSDVTYWLTLRNDGRWQIDSTSRWSPNSSESVAWGVYTVETGTLTLTQTGTPSRIYGAFRYGLSGGGLELQALSGAERIDLARGRG